MTQTKEQKKRSQAKWYQKNKDSHKQVTRVRKEEQIAKLREYVVDYLSTHPCVECGESELIFLDFDHIDQAAKRKAVSQLVAQGYSLQVVTDEIAKCQILCVKCHRIKTSKQMNWYLRIRS